MTQMKKWLMAGLFLSFALVRTEKVVAQIPVAEIIKQAVKKVIRAVDLKIQRLQNKTIWLQNAQKTVENEMSKLKLTEISDWVERQRKLYDDYFQELWKVKTALTYYSRVRAIVGRQMQIVAEYRAAWYLFRHDKNFTADESNGMYQTYNGMLAETSKNIDGLFLIINAFATQMSDAKRLQIINSVADATERTLLDVKEFNEQNKMIAIQRASEKGDINYVKKLYGL